MGGKENSTECRDDRMSVEREISVDDTSKNNLFCWFLNALHGLL